MIIRLFLGIGFSLFHFYDIVLYAAEYPDALPELTPSKGSDVIGLKEHLMTEVGDLIGSSFLYTMVESAREWLEKQQLQYHVNDKLKAEESEKAEQYKVEVKSVGELLKKEAPKHEESEQCKPQAVNKSGKATQQNQTNKKAEVCRFFLQKKCKFGSKCHNLHPGQTTQAQTTENKVMAASRPSPEITNDSSNHSEPKEKSMEQDAQTSLSKKAPLRQAVDVISRILWDPELQTEDFTIGYLDRFTGIIEKPFMAFSWEDIASVGQNVLAVPKHRIQYFKYKDEIIWDKRTQLDNVFGSRGGKVISDIVPPSKLAVPADGDGKPSAEATAKPVAEIKLVEDDASK